VPLRLFSPNPSSQFARQHDKTVQQIAAHEHALESLSDADLKKRIAELKEEIQKRYKAPTPTSDVLTSTVDRVAEKKAVNAALAPALVEVFALVREAAKRTVGERHFDVQMLGGIALHFGSIAEMRTGEGKTLVATLPLSLNALMGRGAHLVTVNDYLAKTGVEKYGPVYAALGLTVGVVGVEGTYRFHEGALVDCSRQEAYSCDITYGTNNEFGFDYLRDNMAQAPEQLVQREQFFAIIDEADSILIDEARTPLIISGQAEASADLYQRFAQIVPKLKVDDDYVLDEKERAVSITNAGITKVESALGIDNLYAPENVVFAYHLEEALKAKTLFRRDKEYVVRDGEVIIVDEFTGRMMAGRRYSEGLHQAIEAKEGVLVQNETETLATVSLQNLFRLYTKLGGMTGTATTEAEEFMRIYGMEVYPIPTHRPMIRQDLPDRVYVTEAAKWRAIVAEVKARNELGQPVLIGTISIEKNEELSHELKRAGIKPEMPNARQPEREAMIISNSGQKG